MRDNRRDFESAPTVLSYKQLNEKGDFDRRINERGDFGMEYNPPRRKKSKSGMKWAIGITAVLLLAGGAGLGIYLYLSSKSTPSTSKSSATSADVQAASGAPSVTTATRTSMLSTTRDTRTTTTTRPVPTPSTSPAVLPPTGKFWWGMTVDNSTELPIQEWTLNGKGGVKPMLGQIFILLSNYNFTNPVDLADYFMRFFGGMPDNGVLMFTVQPEKGITPELAPDSVIQDLANAFRELNIRGHPVLVRTAHEMNDLRFASFFTKGGWYPWGRVPFTFQDYWIRFTTIIRATAPLTSMVWSPTISDQYPYDQRNLPTPGSAEMALLDTNSNGLLDAGDDPYAGFWPGDEWVDWVGGSIYYYGESFPYVDNFVPPTDWITRTLTGKSATTGLQRGPSFYDVYCVQKKKPFIYSETAVYHWPNGTGATSIEQKQGFWRSALNRTALAAFPMVRAVAWFEIAKIEEAWDNQFIDFSLGNDPGVLDAFLADVLPPGNAVSNIDPNSLQWGV
ncbi:hypothetical protein HDU93_002220 [Gonapodya sp. JEL0774]|nr:hypothetical protein HDU93_002220 [Gonapodya sp. JEL0774]